MFVTPQQMADLKLDSDFLANVRNAGVRGPNNELFAGTGSLMVDGVMIHEFRHVFSTEGATAGASLMLAQLATSGVRTQTLTELALCSVVHRHLQWLTSVSQRSLKILSITRTKLVSLSVRSSVCVSLSTTVITLVTCRTSALSVSTLLSKTDTPLFGGVLL